MQTESIAIDLFNEIRSDDDPPKAIARIKQFVADGTSENEHLDFKLQPQNDQQLGDKWSKAISGFANTGGGVIVWGVDCRKDPATKIDCASDCRPIRDPGLFRQRLIELSHNAADPPVAGLKAIALDDPATPGEGFVVCVVPESKFKPHRALRCTNHPYYIRILDSFVVAPHPLLRSLFFPGSSPQLWVDAQCIWDEAQNVTGMQVSYKLFVHNSGLATATSIFANVETIPAVFAIRPNGRLVDNVERGTGIELRGQVHPGAFGAICVIDQTVGVGRQADSRGQSLIPVGSVRILVDLFSQDMPPVRFEVAFGQSEIQGKLTKVAKIR